MVRSDSKMLTGRRPIHPGEGGQTFKVYAVVGRRGKLRGTSVGQQHSGNAATNLAEGRSAGQPREVGPAGSWFPAQ